MRKREVIELRYRIDCVGRLGTSASRQQGTVVKRDCEDTLESKSMAHLTLLCLSYPGGLSGSARKKTAVGSIGQCNGEYKRRQPRSRIRS